MSSRDIAAVHRENAERIQKFSTYLYRLEESRSKTEEYATSLHLFRRDGNRFLHVVDHSGYVDSPENVERSWSPTIYAYAFDGEHIRINDFGRAFAESFVASSEGHLDSIDYLDKLITEDRKNLNVPNAGRPGPHPSGVIAEGLRDRTEGDFADDQFALGLFNIPRMYPPISYGRILDEFVVETVSQADGITTFRAYLSSPPEVLMKKRPGLTRAEAERQYTQWEVMLSIDTAHGCMPVAVTVRDNVMDRIEYELNNVELVQNLEMGTWYPTSYELKSADGVSYSLRLLELSFDPIEESAFTNIFFDEEPVRDDTNQENFMFLLRDPGDYNEDVFLEPNVLRHEDRLHLVAKEVAKDSLELLKDDMAGSLLKTPDITPNSTLAPVPAAANSSTRTTIFIVLLFLAGIGGIGFIVYRGSRRHE